MNHCTDFVRVVGVGAPTVKMCKSPLDEDGNCTNETDEHISTEGTVSHLVTVAADVHE